MIELPQVNTMLRLKKLLNPKSYFRVIQRVSTELVLRLIPNMRGAILYRPGHFHSPLLDIQALSSKAGNYPFDGPEWWENIDLRVNEQRAYFEELLEHFPPLGFPLRQAENYRYFTNNSWFVASDAFTLSSIIRREKPQRIIEIGSGFSSAVVLDTLESAQLAAELTFIEPDPQRLNSLIRANDCVDVKIIEQQVQEVSLSVFEELEANDILFIDSSHVAKVGSDVSFLFLRVLPRLKRGVIVHIHDVFYPDTLPLRWIREGRAWNESLFLRSFLIGNSQFEVIAFNAFAAEAFPEVFQSCFPTFLKDSGGSLWIKKVL